MGYLQALAALASGREATGAEPGSLIGAPLRLRPRSRFEPVGDTGAAGFDLFEDAIPAQAENLANSASPVPAPAPAAVSNRDLDPPTKTASGAASPGETPPGGTKPLEAAEEGGAAELAPTASARTSAGDGSAGDVAGGTPGVLATPADDLRVEELPPPAEAAVSAASEMQARARDALESLPASRPADGEHGLPGEQHAPEVHLSIGRVEVIVTGPERSTAEEFALPTPPPHPFTPQPTPPPPVARALDGTSGFEGYTLRRRGRLR